MADFKAKQKVQLFDGTNERGVVSGYPVYVQLSDGTDVATVNASGQLDVAVGNTVTIQDGGGTISIDDGGGAITVDGSVTVSATDLDIRDLSETQDHVLIFANTVKDGSGTDYVPLVDTEGHLQVDILSTSADDSIKIDDSAFTIATDKVTAIGALADETTPDSVDEGDIGIPRMTLDRKLLTRVVGATDANRLDISASGEAKVIAAANDGVDIGDVTVNNAAGASAVNIQDGGNSITIDGTLTGITNDVNIADGGNSITVDDGGGAITVDGSVTVSATDLDIRDLTHVSDSVKIGDGTDLLAIDASGNAQVDIAAVSVTAVPVSKDSSANSETNPIFVQVVSGATSGVEIHDYDTSSAIAKDATDNHDYTVTATKTLLLKSVIASASGAMKIEIQVGPVATLATVAVAFIAPAHPYAQLFFDPPIEVPDTSTGTVRVIRRNDDNQAQDVYSTIIGTEV